MFQNELQTKSHNVIKTFCSVYISVDSPKQDIFVYTIPVSIAKKTQGLKNSICSWKTCHYEFSTMKKVVDCVLYNPTQIT